MTYTHRHLLFAIIVVLCISLGSTISMVGYISRYTPDLLPSTGLATSGVGNVTLLISGQLSITTDDDNSILFLGCRAGDIIYSNTSGGNAGGDCTGFSPDHVTVRNDGVTDANVTLTATDWGEAHNGSFLDSPLNSSWIAFKVFNASSIGSYSGGCLDYFPSGWVNITDGNESVACDHLGADLSSNSFEFDVAIFIPNGTLPGSNTVSFTFWAAPRN